MSAERATYLDSSAIVKLLVLEAGTEGLQRAIRGWGPLVSSALARTEVHRAALRAGVQDAGRSTSVLQAIGLVAVTDAVLTRAGTMRPAALRSLDAIHLATAMSLGADLQHLCTYDVRMASAAEGAGLLVVAPA